MNLIFIIAAVVLFVALFFVYKILFSNEKANDIHVEEDDDVEEEEIEQREFTLEELHKFNGEKGEKIYVSLDGEVYDVTGSGFYGPGENYHIFAGREASVGLAKNSLDKKYLDVLDLSVLSTGEQQDLNSQVQFFQMKYNIVGWLKEWKEKNADKSDEAKKQD